MSIKKKKKRGKYSVNNLLIDYISKILYNLYVFYISQIQFNVFK